MLNDDQLEQVHRIASAFIREVAQVFFGPEYVAKVLLATLIARGHVLLEGVPGVAKTTLAKTLAEVMGCPFRRVQFTPDLLPADITGTHILNPANGTFTFRPGPLFSHVILGDEINRAPAKTQSALLEAMQEQQATIEGETFPLPSPFMVIATQNPAEHAGTFPLPDAQTDRFLVRLILTYPSAEEEVGMLARFSEPRERPRQVLDPQQIGTLQRLAENVHTEPSILEYVVRIAERTRQHPRLSLGASPRASLSLLLASRAHALLAGRAYVTPDDVKAMAVHVLAHRIVLSDDVILDEDAPASSYETRVIAEVMQSVPHRSIGTP